MRNPLLPLLIALPLIFGAPAQSQPAAPATLGGLPACTTAQHDRYIVRGPDGRDYRTWHPLYDHAQGCIHDHEHGSDPALVMPGYKPLFGVAGAAMGMVEAHSGFKGYAWRIDGLDWYVIQHQGTASAPTGACVEMHELDITIWRNGAIVADLHLMPSFGDARLNESNVVITGCAQPSAATGVRLFPDASARNIGYEPWRVGRDNPPFLQWGDLTFNNQDPQTACADVTCTAAVRRSNAYGPAAGVMRFVKFEGNNAFQLVATGAYSGTFSYAGVAQYLEPGLVLRVAPSECWPFGAAMLYHCATDNHLRPLVNAAQYQRWPVSGPN